MTAVIRDGRWVREDESPLNPIELNILHHQFNRIHDFTKDICTLTHNKIEILSHILNITEEQEKAIINILGMDKEEVNLILKQL